MTPLLKLQKRSSEIRQRLNEIAGLEGDAYSDEVRSENETLQTEFSSVEERLRAAITAEGGDKTTTTDTVDSELRERLELRQKARVGRFVECAMRGRAVDGAEAELMAAANVDGIPLELWERPPESRTENRDATPAPSAGVGVNLDPIRPAIFAPSVIDALMVDMPTVGSGSFSTATITTSVTVGSLAKSGEAVQTAGALTATTVTPKRIAGSLALTLEDLAAIGSENFEAALRENLSMVLSAELDDQLLNGAGKGNDLTGIFQRLTDAADPTASVDGFGTFVAKQASGVDGLWARRVSDIGIVMGVDTYRLAAGAFQGSDAERSALEYMGDLGESVMTNSRMPATASNIQKGLLVRKSRRGIRTAVSPNWGSVQIDDPYSRARQGERIITASVLVGDLILVQPGAYAELAFRVSV